MVKSKRTLSVYYEPSEVSDRYFDDILRPIKKIYPVSKIRKYSIQNINNLDLVSKSHHPRLILTHSDIKTRFDERLRLDGIGLTSNNIGLVKYQRASFFETYYLILHELGHLFGLPHCKEESCVMGIVQEENKINHAWRKLSEKKVNTKHNLLCKPCYSILQRFAIDTDAGGK